MTLKMEASDFDKDGLYSNKRGRKDHCLLGDYLEIPLFWIFHLVLLGPACRMMSRKFCSRCSLDPMSALDAMHLSHMNFLCLLRVLTVCSYCGVAIKLYGLQKLKSRG